MKNITKPTAFQLLFLIVLLTTSSAVFPQTAERTIIVPEVRSSSNGKTFEFIEASVDGKPVRLGSPFVASDDWLSSLTFKIKNTTGKPLRFVQAFTTMPETKREETTLGFSFSYGIPCGTMLNPDCAATGKNLKLILPDEIIEMKFNGKEYEKNRTFIQSHAGMNVINHIRINMISYQLEDGTFLRTKDFVIRDAPKVKE
jgi:hypothetical protein